MRTQDRSEERRDEESARDVRLLLASVCGVAMIVGALVLLVLVRMADVQAGYELYALQKKKVELTQRKSALELELASLRRPDRLARIARDLGLAPPRADQVLGAVPPHVEGEQP